MAFKTRSERNAYRAGLLNGLKEKSNKTVWYKTKDGKVAMSYANNVGAKNHLSEDEIKLIGLDNYTKMQKNNGFKKLLYEFDDYHKLIKSLKK